MRPDLRQRLGAIATLADDAALTVGGIECRTGVRRLLTRAVAQSPALLLNSDRDELVAGAVIYAFTRANLLLGPGGAMTTATLQRLLGLKSLPVDRARRFAQAVAGPPGVDRYSFHPEVYELGDPGLLTGGFRSYLVRLRDRARQEGGLQQGA